MPAHGSPVCTLVAPATGPATPADWTGPDDVGLTADAGLDDGFTGLDVGLTLWVASTYGRRERRCCG